MWWEVTCVRINQNLHDISFPLGFQEFYQSCLIVTLTFLRTLRVMLDCWLLTTPMPHPLPRILPNPPGEVRKSFLCHYFLPGPVGSGHHSLRCPGQMGLRRFLLIPNRILFPRKVKFAASKKVTVRNLFLKLKITFFGNHLCWINIMLI